jgi:integrase/recombinase XerD
LLGFLAGHRGYTRDAYALDLRQFTAWCWQYDHRLFDVRRVDIECLPATSGIAARLAPPLPAGYAPSSGFHRCAEEEGVIEHSPAVHIRRPRIDHESQRRPPRPQRARRHPGHRLLSSPRDDALVSCWR